MTVFVIHSGSSGWNGPMIVFDRSDVERLMKSSTSPGVENDRSRKDEATFEYQECTDMNSALEFLSKKHSTLLVNSNMEVASVASPPPIAAAMATAKNSPSRKRKSEKPKLFQESGASSRWDERFQELFQYKMQHGNCNVSSKSSDDDIKKLGEWVRTQRRRKNGTGAKSLRPLTQEEEGKLNVIGFDWRCPSKPEWDVRYQQLAKFKQIYGHCEVPRYYEDNPPLGMWCVTQRKRKRQKLMRADDDQTNSTTGTLDAAGILADDTPQNKKRKKPSPMTDEQETKLLMLGFEL